MHDVAWGDAKGRTGDASPVSPAVATPLVLCLCRRKVSAKVLSCYVLELSVRSFVRSVPQYLTNGWSNLDETYRKLFTSPH